MTPGQTSPDDDITVYSALDDDRPDHPPFDELAPGDTWRVATIRRCGICHTLTNRWVLGGYPSRGPRCRCPATRPTDPTVGDQAARNSRHENHEELASLLERRSELEQRVATYDVDTAAGERTVDRLTDELTALDNQIDELRAWFDNRFDDVTGVDHEDAEIVTGLQPGVNHH